MNAKTASGGIEQWILNKEHRSMNGEVKGKCLPQNGTESIIV
ncbi:MAG TPA: hypothetical protein VIN08_28235 [Ohtaekwangia sp.]